MTQAPPPAFPVAKPPASRKFRVVLWSLLGLLALILLIPGVVYGPFVLRKPVVSRNFTKEYDDRIRQIPIEQRAWPKYQQALKMLEDLGPAPQTDGPFPGRVPIEPGDPKWPELVEYLNRAQPAFDLLEQGGTASVLGRLRNPEQPWGFLDGSDNDSPITGVDKQTMATNPPLIDMLLPHLTPYRQAARLLARDDALAAMQAGDGERATRDIVTTIRLGALLMCRSSDPSLEITNDLVEQLMGLSLLGMSLDALSRAMQEQPTLLSHLQLDRIATALRSFNGGPIRMDFSAEKQFCADMVQRTYSDDGAGDGRITKAGFDLMAQVSSHIRPQPAPLPALVLGTFSATRKETLAEYERVVDSLAGDAEKPLCEHMPKDSWNSYLAEANTLDYKRRHVVISILMPSLGVSTSAALLHQARRDAALIAIALEQFNAKRGNYPEALASLVPDFLLEIPIDPFDHKPIRYRLEKGKPLIYSIGGDCTDNGGTPPPPETAPDPRRPPRSIHEEPGVRQTEGADWIIWPIPKPPRPAPAEPAP